MENAAASTTSLIQNEVVHLREVSPGCFAVRIDQSTRQLDRSAGLRRTPRRAGLREDPAHGVRVLVLESANPDFFVAHMDLSVDLEAINDAGSDSGRPGPAEIAQQWASLSHWLSTAPVVSIAILRGRARGVGYHARRYRRYALRQQGEHGDSVYLRSASCTPGRGRARMGPNTSRPCARHWSSSSALRTSMPTPPSCTAW